MAGVFKTYVDAVSHRCFAVIGKRLKILEGGLGVLLGIKRLHRLFAATPALTVFRICVFLRQECRIAQHDPAKLNCCRVGKNGPTKAPLHQQRNPAGMINMCMGQHQRVDFGRIKIEILAIALVTIPASLNHSALHQHFALLVGRQVTGTRYLPSCTENLNFHGYTCDRRNQATRFLDSVTAKQISLRRTGCVIVKP